MMCLTLLFLISTVILLSHSQDADDDMDDKWMQFKARHNKQYGGDPLENQQRRHIWEVNVRYIQQHNREYDLGMHTHVLGMNRFGDLTQSEFAAKYLTKGRGDRIGDSIDVKDSTTQYLRQSSRSRSLPKQVDWRKQGWVTPVKNQGECGSCWAFSSTGALEGQYARKTSNLVSFSEQQLVDCSKENYGCNGGDEHIAFNYVQKYGIEKEDSYPYTEKDGRCKYQRSKVVTKITGQVLLPEGDEMKLKEASATVGPISVGLYSSLLSFQFYRRGVYNDPACRVRQPADLDHAALLVGYGLDEDEETSYWLVKNSWGTDWGEHGYIRISRNNNNRCGIATEALYPLL